LPSTLFLESLACCCGVTYVNGGLIGDPLDVKMFESTGWILDESQNIPTLDSISSENVEIVATLYPPSSRSSSMSTASDMSGISKPAYVSELVRRFDFASAL